MRGLALEGGGAKGSYHIGVVKALMESGYEFDGFVGTSIGAINAAILAQGGLDTALDVWQNISMDKIFDLDERVLQFADKRSPALDAGLPLAVKELLTKIIDDKDVGTDKMKAILEQCIDENKLRASGKDYGLVTVSITDRKPRRLMIEDIPQGQLINYIMASASFPGFRSETIGNAAFIDGGFIDNCPYGLLCDMGYDEVIAIRTNAPGIFRRIKDTQRVKIISPREDLGHLMLFSPQRSERNIRLGYYDGLRFAKGLRGVSYYIEPVDINDFYSRFISLNDGVILETGKIMGFADMPAKRMLFEKIIPQLGTHLALDKDYDYADFVIALLELAAKKREVERFKVYDYTELCAIVRERPLKQPKKKLPQLLADSSIFNKRKAAVDLLTDEMIIKT